MVNHHSYHMQFDNLCHFAVFFSLFFSWKIHTSGNFSWENREREKKHWNVIQTNFYPKRTENFRFSFYTFFVSNNILLPNIRTTETCTAEAPCTYAEWGLKNTASNKNQYYRWKTIILGNDDDDVEYKM